MILLLTSVLADEVTDLVNDNAGVINAEYKANIYAILDGLYKGNVAQFAVVTVQSLEGKDIFNYAQELADGKIGDAEKDNGLLLLIAIDERQYRFHVGRGLEPYLNDAKIGRIGRTYLVENFRNEEYGKGIYEAVLSVNAVLTENIDSEYYPVEEKSSGIPTNMIFWIVLLIIMMSSSFRRKKQMKKGEKRNDDDLFMTAMMAGMLFGGRGGSGGFSGGGFGGFGGGGFGGGGAGSGW